MTARPLRASQVLLATGIHVLAHPFRVFQWARRPTPKELHRPLAELLARYKAAAEINFHLNSTNFPAFFAECVALGVPIALGSDAHRLGEVGNFGPHLDVLRQACGSDDPAILQKHLLG